MICSRKKGDGTKQQPHESPINDILYLSAQGCDRVYINPLAPCKLGLQRHMALCHPDKHTSSTQHPRLSEGKDCGKSHQDIRRSLGRGVLRFKVYDL